jgi:DNA-directed RNA polymerase specialized sigma24 family protein
MAPATMRAGYSESSNTRLRHYGTRQPGLARHLHRRRLRRRSRPVGKSSPLCGRPWGTGAAEDAVQEAFRLAAVRWDMMAGCPPETKRGLLCAVAIRTATDEHRRRKRVRPAGYPEDVAGEPPGAGPATLTRVQGGTLPDGDRRNAGDTT